MQACTKSCQASSADRLGVLSKTEVSLKKLHIKSQSYLVFPADDASPVRFLIHVLVTVLVIVRASFHFIPHSSFRPACFHYPRVTNTRLFPPAQLRGWTMHVAVCAVWIRPPPHTPLNASLLLRHIIFADHKIHPQRFPGRT